ncbi:MAG: extradiol ring-cleavage dioxygenase [Sphingomonas sp. SCN 67-18]|uniref:DODA-type extradiol aromatic ring-opening family dioxygenase n=1 Tax=uncultured Sphingomonas sp. TaxID=158754 RepID=UPI00086927E6|nr:extradiol ring-cleavage dioxygenase [Sphingomonas sp. SCN 67-18]ODU21949.1 MAG: extradiol ring-cleavage dioxygenase [Sphingomonas sp. SCN 67-18]
MSLVFAGIMSHGPGMTARADRADPAVRDPFFASLDRMRQALEAARPDALIVVAAEHFANFFMNNMPAYCIGMADQYEGPIEDPDWLRIGRRTVPGNPDLSRRIIAGAMELADVAYAEEWKFDHGIMVPLNFLTPRYDLAIIPANINCQGPPLTPLHRAYAFGQALRRGCDAVPERIALVGTGGISHWPATPNSGRINEAWDRDFLDRWVRNDRDALIDYSDEDTLRDAGQGGFEIRTLISVAGACEGATGDLWFCEPIPIFATSGFAGVMNIG